MDMNSNGGGALALGRGDSRKLGELEVNKRHFMAIAGTGQL